MIQSYETYRGYKPMSLQPKSPQPGGPVGAGGDLYIYIFIMRVWPSITVQHVSMIFVNNKILLHVLRRVSLLDNSNKQIKKNLTFRGNKQPLWRKKMKPIWLLRRLTLSVMHEISFPTR